METVIAAIATPPAAAGIGVVRLSGENALAVADKLFVPYRAGKSLSALPGYTALYGHVADEDGPIDDCVALVFRAPHSYTGENVVELSCHGGRYLLQRVLRAALNAGAVPAGPGEYTRRAFLNGKMDLTGADAVMDLIGAQGRLSAKMALSAREGAAFRRLTGVREQLLGVAAQLGAFIDYPDDDIPPLSTPALCAALQTARDDLRALLSTFEAGRVLREGIDTAIVGAPNVGKSTLMNRLSGSDRSIVTAVAGTTRDVVEETVRLGDVVLRLADTAGIHASADEVEQIGIERARQRLHTAALVLCVFDGSRPLMAEDWALADEAAGETAVAIVSKSDLTPAWDTAPLRERFAAVVTLSAETGEGMDALTQAVATLTGVAALTGDEAMLSTERQRAAAVRCLEGVEEALGALSGGLTADAADAGIQAALGALLELTGERATEAVVDEVFARFCVGK